MRIIKATEAIPVEHPVFTLFGQPGIGKSSLAYSAAEPLALDFDKGAHRASNRRDTLVIESWKDVAELLADTSELANYQTIVIDTVGRCLDFMTADIIQANAKMGRDGNLTQQGWGVLKTRFRTFITQLRALGKDVILIAHHKEEKDGDVTVVRPDITGGSYGEVMKVSDFVGFVYMNGSKRILDFNPTDRWVGKNPAGWRPLDVPPVTKATTFMAGLIAQGREALGAISEESIRITAAVAEWRSKFENMTTVDEVNTAIASTNTIDVPMVQAQAKKLLLDRATALKFTFDQKAKKFVAPKLEAVPA